MKQSCEIRKRPSLPVVVCTPIILAMLGMWFLLTFQFFVSSVTINGWLVLVFVVGILLSPAMLFWSEFLINVEGDGKTFRASRQVNVFGFKLAQRSVADVNDVFWRKESHVESTGVQYHVYAKSQSKPGEVQSNEVRLSGGFWHLISLTEDDVASLRKAFRDLQNAG